MGIIDYGQAYTWEKVFETKVKKFLKGNEPTIIGPEKYKRRFKNAVKKYFVPMSIQKEIGVSHPRMPFREIELGSDDEDQF